MSSKPRPIERKKTDLLPEGGGQVPQTSPGKSPQMFILVNNLGTGIGQSLHYTRFPDHLGFYCAKILGRSLCRGQDGVFGAGNTHLC